MMLYYFWLGAEAKQAYVEYETYRQLARELPELDGTLEE
jgi:hypothetical protein